MISLDLRKMIVYGRRLESGVFQFLAEMDDEYLVDAYAIKGRLFGRHRKSFYGTMLDVVEWDEEEALELSAAMAMDFLATFEPSPHVRVEWDGELDVHRRMAVLFHAALRNGWYRPSLERRRSGKPGWALWLPERERTAWEALRVEAAASGSFDPEDWFSDAVAETVTETPEVRAAWSKLLRAYPGLEMKNADAAEWTDEEEWLEAVGWNGDAAPFRVGLQLLEPEEDEWRLRLFLQNAADPAVSIVCDGDGRPLEDNGIPEGWSGLAEAQIAKDTAKWLRTVPWLGDAETGRLRDRLGDEEAWRFLDEASLQLAERGTPVLLPSWWEELRRSRPRLKARLRTPAGSAAPLFGIDQLTRFDWRIAVGDVDLSEEEFGELLRRGQRLAHTHGRWIQLDPALVEQIRRMMARIKKNKGLTFREILELHLLGGGETADTGDSAEGGAADSPVADNRVRLEVELTEQLGELLGQMTHTRGIPPMPVPESFQGRLRPYQADGVSWLRFMRQYGLGCCLADDMGLGKTVQFIAYLLHARENGPAGGAPPAMLVCPTSVLGNWQKELERFAPTLRVHTHYGTQRARGGTFAEAVRGADLVLTSYTLAQMDVEELSEVRWSALCLDEAQNIKNTYTKQAAAVRRLEAEHRIALTGTPIENRLTELWSIFDFLNPGYLGSLAQFTRRFVQAVEKRNDAERIDRVQRLVRPFLLRRVKKDPAIQLDLPDKNEMKTYVTLTAEQGALYEDVVRRMLERVESLGGMEKRGLILASLVQLKQICNHPALYIKERGDVRWHDRSNKVERLLEMVRELREEGEKCLIFTQFVEMGGLLQSILRQELDEPVEFLHGGVPRKRRDELVSRFQSPQEDGGGRSFGVFLLSLKAGGTGLNLTAANHVFHFDRWWNPAVENQATDRAFRIGQTRDVQVHKLIALGTLEERIDEMIERKRSLHEQIVGGGENWVTELSVDELRDLFLLRREWVEA